MLADARAREHVSKEQALVDLDAVLVALPMRRFGGDLLSRRDQSGNEVRRGVDEIFDAPKRRAAFGQAIVDRLDVSGEEAIRETRARPT